MRRHRQTLAWLLLVGLVLVVGVPLALSPDESTTPAYFDENDDDSLLVVVSGMVPVLVPEIGALFVVFALIAIVAAPERSAASPRLASLLLLRSPPVS